jgi:hypothetical protein
MEPTMVKKKSGRKPRFTKPLILNVSPEQHTFLRREAAERGCSVNDLIRAGIELLRPPADEDTMEAAVRDLLRAETLRPMDDDARRRVRDYLAGRLSPLDGAGAESIDWRTIALQLLARGR